MAVQPYWEKYFASRSKQISSLSPAVLTHRRGVAQRHQRGTGCGGRRRRSRRGRVLADGEVVWSRHPDAWCQVGGSSAGDGSKRARSPGRARRKPLKPLRGECRMFSGVTVVTTLACLFYFTCEAAGASSIRHSLRPPNRGLKEISDKPRAHRAARRRGCVSTSLRGAKATKQSILVVHGLLHGACHRARFRATRWLAMTVTLAV